VERSVRSISRWLSDLLVLVAFAVTCVICLLFLGQRMTSSEYKSIVEDSTAPELLVEKLKALSAPERVKRITDEVQQVMLEPLDINAINSIAILDALGSNPKKSEHLVLEASRRSFRDIQSQLSAVNIRLSRREYPQALIHIDAVLRAKPELSDSLFKLLQQLQLNSESLGSLAEVLAKNPPWRQDFLAVVFNDDKKGQDAFRVLSSIRKAGGRVTHDELRSYLSTQFANKNYEIAYFSWLDFLDNDALRSVSNIFDSKFDIPPHNLYFDWNLSPFANVEIGIVPRPGISSDLALRLDFAGGQGNFRHVQQYLKLASGTYKIAGEWRSDNFESPSGLKWEIQCVDNTSVNASSRSLGVSRSWDKFEFAILIPPENCGTQLLHLRSSSDAVLDQKFDGQIYFDNIMIVGDAKNLE
jgi:hypothetical protein